MNRPNINNYQYKTEIVDGFVMKTSVAYVVDLEEYCDSLEKALDKACEELEKRNPSKWVDCEEMYYEHSKEEWREMLLEYGIDDV